jgi:hypothetical protein
MLRQIPKHSAGKAVIPTPKLLILPAGHSLLTSTPLLNLSCTNQGGFGLQGVSGIGTLARQYCAKAQTTAYNLLSRLLLLFSFEEKKN